VHARALQQPGKPQGRPRGLPNSGERLEGVPAFPGENVCLPICPAFQTTPVNTGLSAKKVGCRWGVVLRKSGGPRMGGHVTKKSGVSLGGVTKKLVSMGRRFSADGCYEKSAWVSDEKCLPYYCCATESGCHRVCGR